jgi:hypothetical protein
MPREKVEVTSGGQCRTLEGREALADAGLKAWADHATKDLDMLRLSRLGMFMMLVAGGWWSLALLAEPAKRNTPAPPQFGTPGEQAAEVAEHAPLFEGWPQPRVALVLSGQQHGYVEPCGCTGLANQKGGLARRHTFFKSLEAKGWDLLPLDAGNQVRRYGRQAELQFQLTAEALKLMKYQAAGLGGDDMRLSAGELLSSVVGDSPFLAANVAVLDRELTPRFRVVEKNGFRLGITAVLGESFRKQIVSTEIVHEPAAAALAAVTEKLNAEKCDFRVLLAFASEAEVKALLPANKTYDLVVLASGPGEPAFEPETLPGTDTLLIRTGAKGMFLAVLGVFEEEGKMRLRYQRVPLDDRFEDSPQVMALFASYQNQLQSFGLEGLGVRPQPHPARQRFVGSEKCGECHTKAFEIWSQTAHAHATDSIVNPTERSDIPRHFDPECLSCHVTGWDPQGYYPFLGGYEDLAKSGTVTQNGCENCHGPGSEHVAAESGEGKFTKADVARLRLAMQLSLQPKKAGEKSPAELKCIECHDIDNSPDFHKDGGQFARYWAEVEHKGKD